MNDQLQINLLEALTKMVNEAEDAKINFADMEEVEQAKRDRQIETGKPYYTLVVYDTEDKQWINEFGDYDKDCVADEMEECFFEVKPKHVKILKTSDNQQAIDAAINKLNGVA